MRVDAEELFDMLHNIENLYVPLTAVSLEIDGKPVHSMEYDVTTHTLNLLTEPE